MRTVIIRCAFGALALVWAACAGEKLASPPKPFGAARDFVLTDSLDIAVYENLYAEEHARLLAEIEQREQTGRTDAGMLEARALVAASEEMYLRDRLEIALKLLDEAARCLWPKR